MPPSRTRSSTFIFVSPLASREAAPIASLVASRSGLPQGRPKPVHIAPTGVGRVKVVDVRRRDLQALAAELLGTGLSTGTVSNVLNPIQAFYRRALDRDELIYNPSERIDLPNGSSKRLKRIASPTEAAALLAALDSEDRPVWATAFYSCGRAESRR